MLPDALAIARAWFCPDKSGVDLKARDAVPLERDQEQSLGIDIAMGPFVDDVVRDAAFAALDHQHSNRDFRVSNGKGGNEPQRRHRRVKRQLNGESVKVGRASGREHAPAQARKKIDRSIPTGLEGHLHHRSSPTRRTDEMLCECDRSLPVIRASSVPRRKGKQQDLNESSP
jgi:hypothetical protein